MLTKLDTEFGPVYVDLARLDVLDKPMQAAGRQPCRPLRFGGACVYVLLTPANLAKLRPILPDDFEPAQAAAPKARRPKMTRRGRSRKSSAPTSSTVANAGPPTGTVASPHSRPAGEPNQA